MVTKFEKAIAQLADPKERIIEKVGGRWQDEQIAYIKAVADLLKDKNLAMIEAETGIGKSLGYLLPSLLWMACNRKSKPILISTHTRTLQKQIIDKDVLIGEKVMGLMGYPMPKVAFRMGKQAFFSMAQAEKAMRSVDPKLSKKSSKAFLREVAAICTMGTGLWQDYLDNFDSFPEGISSDDVCLTEYGVTDNPAYSYHLELSRNADILITNHATVLNRYALKQHSFHALILDEGHEMPGVCEAFSNHRLQMKKLISLLVSTGLTNKPVKEAIRQSEAVLAALVDMDKHLGGRINVLSDTAHFNKLNTISDQISNLSGLINKTQKLYRRKLDETALEQDEAKLIDNLSEANDTLENFVANNPNRRRAIMFSQIKRYPSIASIAVNAGYLFANRLKGLTDKVLVTSATIADINQMDTSFRGICFGLALDVNDIDIALKLAPQNYGKMTFVQASNSTPKPIMGFDEVAELNPIWLDSAAMMIRQAVDSGITLVLTQSFQEAVLLGNRLGNIAGIMVHTPDQKGSEVVNAFTTSASKGECRALITPSTWQGVSFRHDNGGQLLTNLVITRVPYKPVSDEYVQLSTERLMARNKTAQQAATILRMKSLQDAVIKLKQGLGRGIRSPDDVIKVWFCDPRITMADSGRKIGLINAIPKRFIGEFFKADLFEPNKQQVDSTKKDQPKPFYL